MINSIIAAVLLVTASTQFSPVCGQSNKADEAQADFALNLLRETAKPGESAVISPLSITIALSMVYAGADGQTKQQIEAVLAKGINSRQFGIYVKQLLREISYSSAQKKYTLDVANRVYIEQQTKINNYFLEFIRKVYAGGIRQVDFQQKDAVVQEINGWVANATHDKIKNLLSSSNINANTVMMLLNAVYFKGTWATQFNKTATVNKSFQIAAGKEKEVPMMSVKSDFYYFEDDSLWVLGLPYDGNQIQMFLILPKTLFGLSNVLKSLSGQKLLQYIEKSYETEVEVQIPRFKLEKKLQLAEALKKLGIRDLFNENANLRFISRAPLHVSDVTHKAFIEVNEEGTEAAAATGVEISFRSAAPDLKFVADQPFLFTIVKDLRTVLFVGQVAE